MIQEYFKPASVDEALQIKKENPDCIWFSGGTQINYPPAGIESRCVIGLGELQLDSIEMKGETLVIGSIVPIQDLIDSPLVVPPLKEAASAIYSRNIRNIATLGGNLGAKRRDSALIPCLVALSAHVETSEEGILPVEDYVLGNHESLILTVHVPKSPGICRRKHVSRSAGSEPILHTAVRIEGTWSSIQEAVIAIGGIAPPGTRLTPVESALKSGAVNSPEALQAAVAEAVHPESDRLGSAEYKRYIASVVVTDCVADCVAKSMGV